MRERGLVRTAEGEKRRIRIEAEDDCGNRSQLEFDILGRTETLRAEADSTAVVLRPEKVALVRAGRDLTARIPAGAVYEPIFCRPEQRQAPASDSTAAVLSPAYRILDAETPLRHPMTVSVHAFVPDDMQSRYGSRDPYGQRTHRLHRRQIRRRRRDGDDPHHGDIFVAADIIPPQHPAALREGADLGGARSIRFRVSDNFSGIASWHAAHRRPLGALRPFPDAGYARTCVRPTRRKKTPQRAAHGDGQMRQYSPLGREHFGGKLLIQGIIFYI